MIDWPDSLVYELAYQRAIIFLGSGVSASSKTDKGISPPGWKGLLLDAKTRFVKDASDAELVQQFIDRNLLLDAAELIFSKVGQPDRRAFFNEKLAAPEYIPSSLHESIQAINAKIVITTNYDQIYEEQCGALKVGKGYSVRSYADEKLLNDIRSRDNVIIKAHGCVRNTEEIILTRSDYFRIKKDHSYFYKILDSLLLVNSVLFLGCSMTDPDIQLVLENANVAAYTDHPHYAVIPKGTHSALVRSMQSSYNIKALEYEQANENDHSLLEKSLMRLRERVEQVRVEMKLPF